MLADRYAQPVATMRADVEQVLETFQRSAVSATARARRPTWRGAKSVAHGWLGMPRRRKLWTAYATAVVVVVEVLIHLAPLDRVARWLGVPLAETSVGNDLPPLDTATLSDHEREVLAALFWVHRAWLFDATCLRRALAGGWLLRGHRPQLCLGLADVDKTLAHAWLVVDGHSLNGLAGAPLFSKTTRPNSPKTVKNA